MRRLAFTLAAALALTLGVWAVVRWVKSYRVVSLCGRSVGDSRYSIAAAAGGIHLQRVARWPWREPLQKHSRPIGPDGDWQYIDCWEPDCRLTCSVLGFSFGQGQINYDGGVAESAAEAGWTNHSTSYWVLTVPFWFVVASAGVMMWFFWRWRGPRFLGRAGVCANCGYDLRATPQRCPECGCEVPPVPSPAV